MGLSGYSCARGFIFEMMGEATLEPLEARRRNYSQYTSDSTLRQGHKETESEYGFANQARVGEIVVITAHDLIEIRNRLVQLRADSAHEAILERWESGKDERGTHLSETIGLGQGREYQITGLHIRDLAL